MTIAIRVTINSCMQQVSTHLYTGSFNWDSLCKWRLYIEATISIHFSRIHLTMTVETMDGKATSTAEHPPVIVVEQVQVSTLLPSTRRLSFLSASSYLVCQFLQLAGLRQNCWTDFQIIRWKRGTWDTEETFDFVLTRYVSVSVRVTARRWPSHNRQHWGCFAWSLFNSD